MLLRVFFFSVFVVPLSFFSLSLSLSLSEGLSLSSFSLSFASHQDVNPHALAETLEQLGGGVAPGGPAADDGDAEGVEVVEAPPPPLSMMRVLISPPQRWP